MQTFLPYPSFPHSAAALDYRRLGKQRVECLQLLKALRDVAASAELPPDIPTDLAGMLGERRKSGWVNHPAARMWRGYESALALYMTFIIQEWVYRGYKNEMALPYIDGNPNPAVEGYAGPLLPCNEIIVPEWLGEPVFHAGHRARLLHKDPQWYGQFGWREDPSLEYTWPHQLGFDPL